MTLLNFMGYLVAISACSIGGKLPCLLELKYWTTSSSNLNLTRLFVKLHRKTMMLLHKSSKHVPLPQSRDPLKWTEESEVILSACRPYGWLERFDPNFTPNTTDFSHRRYAYQQQPQIGLWNLIQLANALARADLVEPVSQSSLPSLAPPPPSAPALSPSGHQLLGVVLLSCTSLCCFADKLGFG